MESFPRIFGVTMMLAFQIVLFSVFAHLFFGGVTRDTCNGPPTREWCSTYALNCFDFFGNIGNAMDQMFQLLTAANFPDIMMPAYDCYPWASVFFIVRRRRVHSLLPASRCGSLMASMRAGFRADRVLLCNELNPSRILQRVLGENEGEDDPDDREADGGAGRGVQLAHAAGVFARAVVCVRVMPRTAAVVRRITWTAKATSRRGHQRGRCTTRAASTGLSCGTASAL